MEKVLMMGLVVGSFILCTYYDIFSVSQNVERAFFIIMMMNTRKVEKKRMVMHTQPDEIFHVIETTCAPPWSAILGKVLAWGKKIR